mgnify:CR=1 FL=1
MKALVDLLIEKNLSISTCESFTAGLFAYELGKIAGVSKVFKGSLIAYQSEIKESILGIDQTDIDRFGVISEEIAIQMAIAGQRLFNSDVCVSFTGNAGPNAMEGKPSGLWYASIRYYGEIINFTFQNSMDRTDLQIYAVELICDKLLERLRDMPK